MVTYGTTGFSVVLWFQISGVVTQGRGEVEEWVRNYMISYSLDALKWEFARDIYGNKKVGSFLMNYMA
jgi:hypothetical protein